MFTKRLLGVALAGAMMVAAGVASANSLTIEHNAPGVEEEEAGDAGGSIYPWAGGPGAGAGLPSSTSAGPWPNGPGFAPDPSFGNKPGMSGWDASYLKLSSAGWVTFQFMGAGDSGFENSFWVDLNGNAPGGWTQLFQDGQSSNPTDPCPVTPNGAKFPTCDNVRARGLLPDANFTYNQYSFYFDAGYIPFAFDVGLENGATGGLGGPINAPGSAWNWGGLTPAYADATGNPTDGSGFPGYMVGCDPYLAIGVRDETCRAAYVGLADRTRVGGVDHDYQDMGVRISVPEPATLALLGLGLVGLAATRRRISN